MNLNKVLGIFLVLIGLLVVGLNITGFVSLDAGGVGSVSVVRSVVEENVGEGLKFIEISIVSDEPVLAIEESFIGENCSVDNYSVYPRIDVFEKHNNDSIWIFGNSSDSLDVVLNYSIPIGCEVDEDAGVYYVVGGGGSTAEEEGEVENTGGSSGGNNGGGGGGGSGIGVESVSDDSESLDSLSSSNIVQAESNEDYESLVSLARNSLGLVDESQRIEWGSFGTILIMVFFALAIVSFLIYYFLRKPANNWGKKK